MAVVGGLRGEALGQTFEAQVGHGWYLTIWSDPSPSGARSIRADMPY